MHDAPLWIRRFRADEAAEACRWTYDAPFGRYDGDPAMVAIMLLAPEDGSGYYALAEPEADGAVVGFCCYGAEARIPSQTEEAETVDIGGGLRPDRLSQGLATAMLPSICTLALARWAPKRLRVVVASFNERSLRLCRSAGFVDSRNLRGPGDTDFIELVHFAGERLGTRLPPRAGIPHARPGPLSAGSSSYGSEPGQGEVTGKA
jgi:ribosomal-protein-alanine N-acetyltransferase